MISIMLIFCIFAKFIAHAKATGQEFILEEAGSMDESRSQDWWLNSGGIMKSANGEFSTNTGSLSKECYWRKLYAVDNPSDTEDGYQPQNIFRLVTRQKWHNFSQTVYFQISAISQGDSENRNASNGVLFFIRYQDQNNLYYAGLRVDGHAVIKKKVLGQYVTLAERDIFSDNKAYNKNTDPNFLPIHRWVGIRSEIKNSGGNGVDIKLFVDFDQSGDWKLVLAVKDDKAPILGKGFAGIRSDFMDVRFKRYNAK